MNELELQNAIARTEAQLERLRQQVPDPPDVCSICGNDGDDILFAVTVTVQDGEEGYADVSMLLCEDHINGIVDGLQALGFKDHRHGGIDFLEDDKCPGFDDPEKCPTPTKYGPVLITPDGPRQEPDDP